MEFAHIKLLVDIVGILGFGVLIGIAFTLYRVMARLEKRLDDIDKTPY